MPRRSYLLRTPPSSLIDRRRLIVIAPNQVAGRSRLARLRLVEQRALFFSSPGNRNRTGVPVWEPFSTFDMRSPKRPSNMPLAKKYGLNSRRALRICPCRLTA